MNSLSHQTSSILPMNVEADFIKEVLDAGLNKQAIKIISSLIHQTSSIEAPVPCHPCFVRNLLKIKFTSK